MIMRCVYMGYILNMCRGMKYLALEFDYDTLIRWRQIGYACDATDNRAEYQVVLVFNRQITKTLINRTEQNFKSSRTVKFSKSCLWENMFRFQIGKSLK